MKFRLIVLVFALMGEFVFADEDNLRAHVSARTAAVASQDGLRKLHVYSKEKLNKVRYRVADQDSWYRMVSGGSSGGYYVYSTSVAQQAEPGATFEVVGVTQKNLQVIDQLTVQEENEVEVVGLSEKMLPAKVAAAPRAQATSPVMIDQHTLYHGSPYIHPNTLALARARAMAQLGRLSHFGSAASLQTTHGRLCEGLGKGGPNCGTCSATNGTAAIGDGQVVGRDGMTYRCRLYNSPGTTSGGWGGGGGRGWFGRR